MAERGEFVHEEEHPLLARLAQAHHPRKADLKQSGRQPYFDMFELMKDPLLHHLTPIYNPSSGIDHALARNAASSLTLIDRLVDYEGVLHELAGVRSLFDRRPADQPGPGALSIVNIVGFRGWERGKIPSSRTACSGSAKVLGLSYGKGMGGAEKGNGHAGDDTPALRARKIADHFPHLIYCHQLKSQDAVLTRRKSRRNLRGNHIWIKRCRKHFLDFCC